MEVMLHILFGMVVTYLNLSGLKNQDVLFSFCILANQPHELQYIDILSGID